MIMMTKMTNKKCVVLLSGGLDSATVLAIAKAENYTCYALSFNYGQRHIAELEAAKKIAAFYAIPHTQHKIFDIDLNQFGGSALTDNTIDVPTHGIQKGIPITYVPARNTIMLAIALSWAECLGAQAIFYGANAVDYSGYPDCRPHYVQAFENMANLATQAGIEGKTLKIHTPIIDLSKADIIRLGITLGVDYALTVSCYQADALGRACGVCDACRLRKIGFEQAQVSDPTQYV
jgi:7-cyano-7-deazaguanine synthase